MNIDQRALQYLLSQKVERGYDPSFRLIDRRRITVYFPNYVASTTSTLEKQRYLKKENINLVIAGNDAEVRNGDLGGEKWSSDDIICRYWEQKHLGKEDWHSTLPLSSSNEMKSDWHDV
jgi:hypothetical protein